jgi:betaine-aldehyde dehydrogenase
MSASATKSRPARARAPRSADLARGLFFDGAWQHSSGGRLAAVINPATGKDLGTALDCTTGDVGQAVAAARRAFDGWRLVPAQERARMVRAAAARLRDNSRELALMDTHDCGNPIAVTTFEVGATIEFMEYFAGLITELKGDTIPIGPGTLNYSTREPLGVVARICSFNHPILYAAGKTAAPLVTGNTVVVKPAEQTPMSTMRIAELWKDIFPPGVYNVVTGGREAGAALADHPDVAKISLIGSPAAGRAVMASAAGTIKRLTLELGGKNAFVACADTDPAAVAEGILKGLNLRSVAGQSCNSTSRIFLHDAIHDETVDHLARLFKSLKVGLPDAPGTEMGALTSRPQFDKTMSYIRLALIEGATLRAGGGPPDDPALANGFFVSPTLFVDVKPEMRIAKEEVFGPVAAVLRWSDEAEMLKAVNGLDFGLTAAVWSRDIDEAMRISSRIDAGYLWINDAATHHLGVPFGGFKQSGYGREESFDELIECTQVKNVSLRFKS